MVTIMASMSIIKEKYSFTNMEVKQKIYDYCVDLYLGCKWVMIRFSNTSDVFNELFRPMYSVDVMSRNLKQHLERIKDIDLSYGVGLIVNDACIQNGRVIEENRDLWLEHQLKLEYVMQTGFTAFMVVYSPSRNHIHNHLWHLEPASFMQIFLWMIYIIDKVIQTYREHVTILYPIRGDIYDGFISALDELKHVINTIISEQATLHPQRELSTAANVDPAMNS